MEINPMIIFERTDSTHPDFVALVQLLDADLAIRDGADNAFYSQFNKIDKIKNAIVAFDGDRPVGCGAIKEFDSSTMEVKRMFTLPEYRGRGVASHVLNELEKWAGELGYSRCVLETGKRQPEAIALYHKEGYRVIENYGQYKGMENSVCFDKSL
jgi:putative acetyltransferase